MIQVAPWTEAPAKSVCTSATARFATVVSSSARKAAPAATASTFSARRGMVSATKSTIGRALYHTSNGRATFSPVKMDAESLEALARAEPEVADDPDGRKRRGNATRESILQAAADLASVEGLEGLTIGRLATELNMSKSGLFAHFGSKEELQLATIGAARRRFVDHVVRPSRHL